MWGCSLIVKVYFLKLFYLFVVFQVILCACHSRLGSRRASLCWLIVPLWMGTWSDRLKMLANAAMRYGRITQWAFGWSQYLTQLQTCSPCSKMRSGFSLDTACKYAKENDRDRRSEKQREREKDWQLKYGKAWEGRNVEKVKSLRYRPDLCELQIMQDAQDGATTCKMNAKTTAGRP